MADDGKLRSTPETAPVPEDDCPLPPRQQMRNILCFAGFWCIYYLAAPVSYVGVTHANLLKDLGNSDTVANLPKAAYQWLAAVPILVAWFLPQPRLLKPLLVISLVLMAAVCAAVAVTLGLGMSSSSVRAAVIAHGAVFGAANGVLLTTLWEVLRRGVSTARRGQALGITFGAGPVMACVGSLVQQALFAKEPFGVPSLGVVFPQNYLVLFAAAAPLMLLAAAMAMAFVIPLSENEPAGGSRVVEILGGVREFFTYRPLIMGAVAYLLVYAGGNAIMENVSIHAKDVLGEQIAKTVGYQNFLRFGFKAGAGVFLGWLLAKTNPRATLLATTAILIFAMGWVLNVPGWLYLLSAGFLGAGELFGAHFPNYIATASSKSQVRLNIAYMNLMAALVGFASIAFGEISDRYGRIASFYTATLVLVFAMGFIILVLPAKPVPREA